MLVLAWKLDAQSMGYFTRQEWLRGMSSLQYVTSFPFCHCMLFFFCFFFTLLYLPQHAWCLQTISIYLNAFSALVRCDSTERLRNSLDYLRSVLNDSTSFKLIYRYAFDFARVSQAKLFFAVTDCTFAQDGDCYLEFFFQLSNQTLRKSPDIRTDFHLYRGYKREKVYTRNAWWVAILTSPC